MSESFTATFPAMYYSSPVNQMAAGIGIESNDSLTAAMTAGAPYFTITSIDVCNVLPVITPPLPPGEAPANPRLPSPPKATPTGSTKLSAPVATSDGVKPLSVLKGQYARLWITANVPKGALPPGAFSGTAVVTGKNATYTVTLKGAYLGTLMGNVTVQPATVAPGQPVLVQVCDASGKPISDPTVTVTIQGVQATARYYQFPTVGIRNFIVRAVRGPLSETSQATVNVAGTPLGFRLSLAPPLTEIPMLQTTRITGRPYAATFMLGNTMGVRRMLASAVANAKHVGQPPAAPTAPASSSTAPTDALGAELAKVIATLPADKVTHTAPSTIKTATSTANMSAVLAPIGGLQTKPIATTYQWDFGDGQKLTTQSPSATHDYFPAIKAGKIAHSFDVTCTVVHDNLTVKQTLVLHSAYGLCRQLGIIVPPVTGPDYATFQHIAFSASLIVHNLEASDIVLSAMACLPVSDDASVTLPAPKFTTMKTPILIAANSATALGIYISLDQLKLSGAVTNGFIVYYSGAMQPGDGTTVPVRFSYALRIPLTDSGWASTVSLPAAFAAASWDLDDALKAISAMTTLPASPVSKSGSQILDPATNTIAIPLSADPHASTTAMQVSSAVRAGLTSIALKTGALDAKGNSIRLAAFAVKPPAAPAGTQSPAAAGAARSPTPLDHHHFDPLNPPSVAAGNDCYPDDISDAAAATAAAEQLVCQLTNITETVSIMSQFQNALQGDIILSPAPVSGDMIAAMFKALTPPQHHGHSGLMTANFFEITHCTASPDRITKNVNKDGVGIPTSLNGNMLQYGWPGSLTQSVQDATTTMPFIDPNGGKYTLNSFNTDQIGDGMEIIPPLVVKPLPENETAARPLLRKAADTARSKGAQYDSNGNLQQKGGCYYSFYAYTDPQLSAGFTDPAGADAGWAQGLSPAVCSSFVWMSMKDNNIPAVTSDQYEKLSDFSASAVAGGAQVGPATLDGLIFYPQAERLQGAQALYQMFMNMALSQEFGLGTIPGINSTIAGPLADQLLNDFASGNPNLVGSNAWQTPGDGNAVSPDNIIWWNPPYFGNAEPLQYLPTHTEQYIVSQWKKVISWGSIKGTVTYNGAPVPNAHVWVYIPGGDTYTAADGTYTLNHVPIGLYLIQAQAVITTNGVSAEYTNGLVGTVITLTAADSNITENIALQGLPQNYRRLDMTYSISCDHGDDNPWNTHGVQTAGPYSQSIDVDPGFTTNSFTYNYDYNGGGYFHIDYVFSIALRSDSSIDVTLVGTMYDDGGGSQQAQYTVGPFNVAMGASISGWMNLDNSNGYHNGPANFTFSVTNNQQTG